ncbi:uncharacterized protein LOC143287567 [Babylonia areolata]|uniref:uncharacterized protein LOC143287567 n=1 Tax=Babylonia areolata TaxID=304850 RepID=UPI003FD2D513
MATGGHNYQSDGEPNDSSSGTGQRQTSYNLNVNTDNAQFTDVRANSLVVQNPVFVNSYGPFRRRHYPPPWNPNVRDEALGDFPPPEDLSYLFKPEDLERTVEEKLLNCVAMAFEKGGNITWLARKLDVTLDTERCHNDYREQVYQVLLKWQRRNAAVKVRDLVKALCESRNPDPVKVLNDYLR